MIRQIRLQNFMSHVDTTIELGPGLTVLTGPNNCGKSAVVSALSIMARNSGAAFPIRHGAKEARVTVTVDNGGVEPDVICWHRRASGGKWYTINDHEYRNVGQGERESPFIERLHQTLRLAMVQLEGADPVELHIAAQKSPIFLLDQERQMAGFFAASSDIVLLIRMRKMYEADLKEAKAEQKAANKDLASKRSLLQALEPVPELQKNTAQLRLALDQIKSAENRASALRQRLERLTQLHTARLQCQQRVERFRGLDAILTTLETAAATLLVAERQRAAMARRAEWLARCEALRTTQLTSTAKLSRFRALTAPPSLADTLGLRRLLANLQHHQHRRDRLTRLSSHLAPLSAPPSLSPTQRLATVQLRTKQLRHRVANLQAVRAQLDRLLPIPTLDDSFALAQRCQSIDAARRARRAAEARAAILANLQDTPALANLTDRRSALQRWLQTHERQLQAVRTLNQAAQAVEEAWHQVQHHVTLHPRCPVCNSAVDVEQLRDGGETRD